MNEVIFKDAKGNPVDMVEIRKLLGDSNTANLEKSSAAGWMNKEIAGIPAVPGLIGGTVAELTGALTAKIPQLSTLFGGNVMVTDLVWAFALGWLGKKYEWAKYGSMFMVFAAFQDQIQKLIGGITKAGTTATTSLAMEQANTETPAEIERWLKSQ